MIVRFRLNGENIEEDVKPNETLLVTLRNKLRLVSVKKGCDEGACVDVLATSR
jgi:carbon-monoxide dehydrogenase small subunit